MTIIISSKLSQHVDQRMLTKGCCVISSGNEILFYSHKPPLFPNSSGFTRGFQFRFQIRQAFWSCCYMWCYEISFVSFSCSKHFRSVNFQVSEPFGRVRSQLFCCSTSSMQKYSLSVQRFDLIHSKIFMICSDVWLIRFKIFMICSAVRLICSK